VLPNIPDNDTSTCWVPRCRDDATGNTGLCFVHNAAIRPFLHDGRELTGRAYDLLGLRLNVLQESHGACLRAAGPCDITMCRHHVSDSRSGEPVVTEEPCAVKLAGRGGMTLDEIAAVMGNVTRERIRQCEMTALRSLRRACERAGIRLEDVLGAIAA